MKFINGAIVMTDEATGKPYARAFTASELNLVLAIVQGFDEGALRAQEIAPFILRGVNVSEERARQIVYHQRDVGKESINARINAKLPRSITEALIGKEVRLQISKRTDSATLSPAPTGPNPIDSANACQHETIIAGVCIACDKRVRNR